MTIKNFKWLTIEETYISYNVDPRITFSRLNLDMLEDHIEEVAAKSNFSKWLKNWNQFHGNRVTLDGIIGKEYRIMDFIKFKPNKVIIEFDKRNSFILLDDPNDPKEWINFILRGHVFVARLTEIFYSNPVFTNKLSLDHFVNLRKAKLLTDVLKANGIAYHLPKKSLPSEVVLKNDLKLWLLEDDELPDSFIDIETEYNRALQKGLISVNMANLEKNIKEKGSELIHAINTRSLTSFFSNNETQFEFDEHSNKDQFDLQWNTNTKEKIADKYGIMVYRTNEGYIVCEKTIDKPIHYFRPTWREMDKLILEKFR